MAWASWDCAVHGVETPVSIESIISTSLKIAYSEKDLAAARLATT
jgi:hypothetical protein